MLKDLYNLVFPNLCAACAEPLPKGDSKICPACFESLPQTYFHIEKNNAAERIFYGRFDFENVCSAFYFSKGNAIQNILHEIKYNSNTTLAEQIATWYGKELSAQNWFDEKPLFVPVPLHKKKLYKRGYNQAMHIAQGLALGVGDATAEEYLVRTENSASQTRKSRYARWENVENLFRPKNEEKISARHVVLVDDVLTTGATLEACAAALRPVVDGKISAITLAFAGN